MNQLALVLVLALASANASKFDRSPGAFQQEKSMREFQEEPFYSNDGIDEREHFGIFLPRVNFDGENFDPPAKSYTQFRGSRLPDSEGFKIKRTDASLSIVNALDVLRQRIMMEFARRKMNESKAQIQKNRELLIKTGKRSQEESEEPSNYRMPRMLLWKRSRNEELEKALPIVSSESSRDADRIQTQSGYRT